MTSVKVTMGTTAAITLKPVRKWSHNTLEREVRVNLVYRAFTRIGDEKVPDMETLARLVPLGQSG